MAGYWFVCSQPGFGFEAYSDGHWLDLALGELGRETIRIQGRVFMNELRL